MWHCQSPLKPSRIGKMFEKQTDASGNADSSAVLILLLKLPQQQPRGSLQSKGKNSSPTHSTSQISFHVCYSQTRNSPSGIKGVSGPFCERLQHLCLQSIPGRAAGAGGSSARAVSRRAGSGTGAPLELRKCPGRAAPNPRIPARPSAAP